MTLAHRIPRPARFGALLAALGLLAAAVVAPVLAADHAVSIVGREFEPAEITVAPGDTVIWTVTEAIGAPHSVTSGEPDFSGQGGTIFDSGVGLQDEGLTYEHTFAEAGVFDYFCTVHADTMRGRVTVVAPGQSPPEAGAPPSAETGVPVETRLLAGGILLVSIVLMFGLAWLYRRMNPA